MELEYYSQAGMEQTLRLFVEKINRGERGGFNTLLSPRFVSADWQSKSCTLAYHPKDWMSNPAGVIHGGILSSVVDLSMGFISIYVNKEIEMTPTVSLTTNYLRPVPMDRDFYVVSSIDHTGRRLNQLHCAVYTEGEPDKPCVTASGTYFVERKE